MVRTEPAGKAAGRELVGEDWDSDPDPGACAVQAAPAIAVSNKRMAARTGASYAREPAA